MNEMYQVRSEKVFKFVNGFNLGWSKNPFGMALLESAGIFLSSPSCHAFPSWETSGALKKSLLTT